MTNCRYIGVDHRPLLAFFRKFDPKPLDHIVNKRLRQYVSEINALRFTIFYISSEKISYWIGGDFPVLELVMTKERILKVQGSQTKQLATKVQSSHILQAQILGSTLGCPQICPLICPLFARSLLGFLPTGQWVRPLMQTIRQMTLAIKTTMCRKQCTRWHTY